MGQFDTTIAEVITICGTFSFAVSGAFAAMQKRLDVFGVLIIAFATSVGGGTLRDILLGDTPVFWLKSANYSLLILVTAIVAVIFWKRIKKLREENFLNPENQSLSHILLIQTEQSLLKIFGKS